MRPLNFAGAVMVGTLGALAAQQWRWSRPCSTHDVVSYVDSVTVCGTDVDVQLHWIANEFLRRDAAGNDYYSLNVRETNVSTNPETGKFFTQFSTYRNQDQSYRDNGDGTSTVTVKAVGPTRLADDN